MLEQLLHTAVQYIDTAMVGALGTQATAAVGSTTTVNWLIGSTITALGVGFLAFISQNHGAGKLEEVKRASAQAVMTVLVVGSFFTLLTLSISGIIPYLMQVDENIRPLASRYFFILYTPMLFRTATIIFGTVLRAVGDTKTPMRVGVVVNITNILLNYFLIFEPREIRFFSVSIKVFGMGLGVIGAGIASALAFFTGGVLITIVYFRHSLVKPKGYSMLPDMEILKPCLRVALPNALQRFGTSLGYVIFAAMVNSLGEVSTAAHTIANTVESAFYVPGFGMQAAAATLSGNAYGAKEPKRIKQLGRTIMLLEAMLMIISGSLLFCFADEMMKLFSNNAEVIKLGSTVLKMVALSEPFYGISIVIEGMLQGMGKTMVPFICNIAGMWGIRIIGTFICITFYSFGLIGAWSCMIAHNLMLFIMFAIYYRSGKWNNLK